MKSLAPSEFVDSLIPINKKKKLPDQFTKKAEQIWLLIRPIWLLKISNVNNFTKSPVRFLKVRAASGKLSDVKFQN